MATIIVPLATSPRTKEVMALAAELVGEGVNPGDALVQANAMVDELHAYAEEWDRESEAARQRVQRHAAVRIYATPLEGSCNQQVG